MSLPLLRGTTAAVFSRRLECGLSLSLSGFGLFSPQALHLQPQLPIAFLSVEELLPQRLGLLLKGSRSYSGSFQKLLRHHRRRLKEKTPSIGEWVPSGM